MRDKYFMKTPFDTLLNGYFICFVTETYKKNEFMTLKANYSKFVRLFFPYAGTVYSRIGGKKTINQVVDDFYEVMKTDPIAKDCLATHQGDLAPIAQKLKEYLYGWLGGPQVFVKKYGHPRMRMRHINIPIGLREAEQWIYCMKRALQKSNIDQATQEEMLEAMKHLATIIINQQ